MTIINKLEKYLNDNCIDEIYFEIIDDLGTSDKNQKEVISFIQSNNFNVENCYKIFNIIRELYGFEEEEDYNINLIQLYEWILELMFTKELYEYSICYKFSDLLMKMSKDKKKVFDDIIKYMDFQQPITIQIAICSMYGHHNFFDYKQLGQKFLDIIYMSMKKNPYNKQIKEDFNLFIKPILKLEDYKNYKSHL